MPSNEKLKEKRSIKNSFKKKKKKRKSQPIQKITNCKHLKETAQFQTRQQRLEPSWPRSLGTLALNSMIENQKEEDNTLDSNK
jgi:hypothetical protein